MHNSQKSHRSKSNVDEESSTQDLQPRIGRQAGGRGNAAAQEALQSTPTDGMGEGGKRPKDWGKKLGSLDGVDIFSNGGETRFWERGTYGYMYQCVEFVNRYSVQANGTGNMKGTGNAIDYAGPSRKGFGYTWVPNDGTDQLPERGDILVFGGGAFGHVAIASSGGPGGVNLAQQNTSSPTASLGVSGGPGKYKVGGWGSRKTLGWQHHGASKRPSTPTKTGGGSTGSSGERPGTTPTSPSTGQYTVQRGDTLWGIAQRLLGDGARYRELVRLNGLKDPSQIVSGQVLRLPGGLSSGSGGPTATGTGKTAPKAPSATPTTSATPSSPPPSAKKSTWTVKVGDTLWDIAEKSLGSGGRYPEIARLNRIANPSVLRVGQILQLPAVRAS